MEKENEESLIKIRSARAAIAEGFRLYTSNFRRIFRATWIHQLVFAVVSGVAEALLVVYYPLLVAALMLLWYVMYRFLLRRRLTMIATVKFIILFYELQEARTVDKLRYHRTVSIKVLTDSSIRSQVEYLDD
jgi:hypothetical protein